VITVAAKGAAAAIETVARTSAAALPSVKAVVSAASLLPGSIAPGMTVSVVGSALGPETPVAHDLRSHEDVRDELGEVRVWFDDVRAPLTFVSDSEIKAIVPYAVAERESAKVTVEYRGARSEGIEVSIDQIAPGVFTADQSGTGQAVALTEDMLPNSAERPAARGSVVTLYATGEGLPKPMLPAAVTVAGVAAEVLSATLAPGLPGVLEVRFRVPASIAGGAAVPVVLLIGDTSSQPETTIAIE
jgi:uncharacterized protein (TIGR03437 family)